MIKHPTMQSQHLRYALACVAARFLLANIRYSYPLFLPELLPPGIALLTIAIVVLTIIAYCTANRRSLHQATHRKEGQTK